ncbi:thionin-2.2-like isoform X2 [Olea europaea var. sylvestris]|uniref:Thionin-like protein n=1 Tax=Olea europaea subsp. europaea TaxID=158383 RepID=A0A8S0SPY7_OLEEU|nr:thionin-2.2-like isoform X2 [Olea europaea var. sylvestris]CAA2994661.1 Hypothetical predicted protein [Olea europaea subsp. europaea]
MKPEYKVSLGHFHLDKSKYGDTPQGVNEDVENLGFCKLGCAFSMCSTISTKQKPNGEKVDNCVGSCSTKCTKNYSLP